MTDIVDVPVIPALPTPPSTNDPNNFSARADGFLGILPEWSQALDGIAESAKTNATAAQERAATAQVAASIATVQATHAAASAELAKNAPTTYGLSNQTLTIAAGAVNLTVEAGRAFISGQAVVLAALENPTSQRMYGIVTAYNATTGALSVTVSAFTGSGAAIGWTVTLGNAPARGGLSVVNMTEDTNAAAGHFYVMETRWIFLKMPEHPSLNDEIGFCNIADDTVAVIWNGKTVKGVSPFPSTMNIKRYQSAIVRWNGSTWV